MPLHRMLWARRDIERAQAEADRQWREQIRAAIQEAKAKRDLYGKRERIDRV